MTTEPKCEKCGKTKAEHHSPMEYCYEFGPIKQRFTSAPDAEKPEWRELVGENSWQEFAKSNCNRYVNGECRTLRCLRRGGWDGKTGVLDASIATCEQHEALTENSRLQSRLSSATERAEKAKSKARDQQHTFEFGGRVMNQLVLTRVGEIKSGEFAFDALERWLKEREQLRAQVETLKGALMPFAAVAIQEERLKIEQEKSDLPIANLGSAKITMEHCRSAKSAINQTEGGTNGTTDVPVDKSES